MAWDLRGKARYYYRSKRIGGKVVRIYCGAQEAADEAAEKHRQECEERKRRRQEGEQIKKDSQEIGDHVAMLRMAAHLERIENGYIFRNGDWRKMTPKTISKIRRGEWIPTLSGLPPAFRRYFQSAVRAHYTKSCNTPENLKQQTQTPTAETPLDCGAPAPLSCAVSGAAYLEVHLLATQSQ